MKRGNLKLGKIIKSIDISLFFWYVSEERGWGTGSRERGKEGLYPFVKYLKIEEIDPL